MKKIIVIVLLFSTFMTGCRSNNNYVENKEKDISISTISDSKDIVERSEKLSDIIVEQYGIDDVTTIILNDTAIIGVRLAYDQKIDDIIKEKVQNIVLNSDSLITIVKVSDNKEIYESINDIVLRVLQGQEYEILLNDINDINNKI